jgi:hypothetical protein
VPTKGGNTNNDGATNGQSLHRRRHWFAAISPSWRSRTRSWTPRGTPPKEAAGRRVKHKKMQIGALWSRRATALAQCLWSCGSCASRGHHLTVRVGRQLLQQRLGLLQHACRTLGEPAVQWSHATLIAAVKDGPLAQPAASLLVISLLRLRRPTALSNQQTWR